MVARSRPHYPCLDGLRGLAILLVVPHNADIVAPVLHGPFRYLTIFIDRGWVGVQLFFVLSGFLITEQLCGSRRAANYYAGFYARRTLRILPLFFAAIILALFLVTVLQARGEPMRGVSNWYFWLAIFFINWTQPLGLSIPGFPQFWSLAVEEQFYLLWPTVVRAFAARLFVIAGAIVIGALAARLVMLALGATSGMVYMWTISRMDALAFGALAALTVQHWRARGEVPAAAPIFVWAAVVAVIGALSTRLYAAATWSTQTVGFSCLGLACLLILLSAVASDISPMQSRWFGLLRSRALASVGRYSYGMYVFHMFFAIYAAAWIKHITAPFGDARMLACAVLMIALSYVAGFLSYHLYEKHFLRLSHRYFEPQ
jgi:peptidoglycan/LPS O-acetylase OafA/YrhL